MIFHDYKKKRSTQNLIKGKNYFTKVERPNLKQVENELLTKIIKMKNNYQRNSIGEKDIFDENIDIFNNIVSPIRSSVNNFQRNKTIKKKIINKESINSNFSSKNKSWLDNNFAKLSNINSNSNKAQTVIIKTNEKKTNENNKKFAFTELRKFSEKELPSFINKKTKNDIIRNIKRTKNLYDSFDDDESEKDDDFHGKTISPKSNIIFFFDFFMVLSSIYCLFYIPLRMAKFDCFCNDEHMAHKCILYIIDLLFICDLCISFFRGYYNYQFKLIKNNKKIFIHYLKTDFSFDLLEAIPIFTYSNFLCMKNSDVHYCFSNYMSYSLIMLRILTSIKIMKIFKVRNKQKNVAFNYFFNLFSENYSLEKIIDNISDFIFCLLAFHFFVCLNIFISKQTYPNWIYAMELNDKSLLYIYKRL